MKVIKVIVDDTPWTCSKCKFCVDKMPYYCRILDRFVKEDIVFEARPDWCPLVTHNQAFDWIFFEAKATKYIEETITDIANGKVPKYKLLKESEDE